MLELMPRPICGRLCGVQVLVSGLGLDMLAVGGGQASQHQGVGGDENTEQQGYSSNSHELQSRITLLQWRFCSLHWTLDICQDGGSSSWKEWWRGPHGQGSAHSSQTHSYPPSHPPQSHHFAVSDTRGEYSSKKILFFPNFQAAAAQRLAASIGGMSLTESVTD